MRLRKRPLLEQKKQPTYYGSQGIGCIDGGVIVGSLIFEAIAICASPNHKRKADVFQNE